VCERLGVLDPLLRPRRRRTSEALEEGQVDKERAALSRNETIQPLTGDVGVMIETRCKESWQQKVLTRWKQSQYKRTAVAAAFCVLVGLISLLTLFDENVGLGALPDINTGVVGDVPVSTASVRGMYDGE